MKYLISAISSTFLYGPNMLKFSRLVVACYDTTSCYLGLSSESQLHNSTFITVRQTVSLPTSSLLNLDYISVEFLSDLHLLWDEDIL